MMKAIEAKYYVSSSSEIIKFLSTFDILKLYIF